MVVGTELPSHPAHSTELPLAGNVNLCPASDLYVDSPVISYQLSESKRYRVPVYVFYLIGDLLQSNTML